MALFLSSLLFAYRTLRSNFTRTLLTLSGIIIGSMAILLVLSLGDAVRAYVFGEIESFGTDLVQVEVKTPSAERNSVSSATAMAQGAQITTLTLADGEAIARLPGVRAWYGAMIGQALAQKDNVNKQVMLFGAGAEAPEVDPGIELSAGRFYSVSEDEGAAQVAVIGAGVRESLFGGRQPVGETFKLKDQTYRVVGVLAERGSTGFVSFDDFVYVPIHTLQKKVLGVDHVSAISVALEDAERAPQVAASIDALLRDRHDIDKPGEEDYSVTTIEEVKDTLDAVLGAVDILLVALASVSLVVGGIGVMNVMFVSVTERTREIGLRKAVGARDRDIVEQFLVEALVFAVTGGMLGILLAGALLLVVGQVAAYFGFPAVLALSLSNVSLAFAFALASGLLFGLYPATRAARILPIDAIRR